jgi:hypothetical protein
MLLPEDRGFLEVEGMEKTYKITQNQLQKEVDITTAQKVTIRGAELSDRDTVLIYPRLALISPTIRETDDIY